MNTDKPDKPTNKKYLWNGDVVTINGKKYLCEQQSPDVNHCRYCAFDGYRCLLPKELNYECASDWVALTKIEDVIKREQEEIDEHQRYIKYLEELL